MKANQHISTLERPGCWFPTGDGDRFQVSASIPVVGSVRFDFL
jgi:hypothetical protein